MNSREPHQGIGEQGGISNGEVNCRNALTASGLDSKAGPRGQEDWHG